ncbi:response regulator transcription factor [Nitrospirillum pindoramense]|uniref:Regulatory LuxR family protein n=1 Tax=Nitrospirillum amazonense TaxID=28077 RepID=A0A560H8G7_9PROT|nr:LuxR family transcriptional regulator [Nitrospirillum amazonense]TWB42596.1 regulatory LuxR family protein [Nitrospirillum amazonense]
MPRFVASRAQPSYYRFGIFKNANLGSDFPSPASVIEAMRPMLSPREAQCLRLLAQGEGTKQIAHQLGLRLKSVDAYLLHARQKLGAKTSTHAVVVALAMGLLEE